MNDGGVGGVGGPTHCDDLVYTPSKPTLASGSSCEVSGDCTAVG